MTDAMKQKIIEMRHGNPPDFDAEPLTTLRPIANVVGIKRCETIGKYLTKFYAEYGIKRKSQGALIDT